MRKSEDGLSRLELGKKSGVRKGKMAVLETKGRGRKMESHSDEKQAMRGRDRETEGRGEGCEGWVHCIWRKDFWVGWGRGAVIETRTLVHVALVCARRVHGTG